MCKNMSEDCINKNDCFPEEGFTEDMYESVCDGSAFGLGRCTFYCPESEEGEGDDS